MNKFSNCPLRICQSWLLIDQTRKHCVLLGYKILFFWIIFVINFWFILLKYGSRALHNRLPRSSYLHLRRIVSSYKSDINISLIVEMEDSQTAQLRYIGLEVARASSEVCLSMKAIIFSYKVPLFCEDTLCTAFCYRAARTQKRRATRAYNIRRPHFRLWCRGNRTASGSLQPHCVQSHVGPSVRARLGAAR